MAGKQKRKPEKKTIAQYVADLSSHDVAIRAMAASALDYVQHELAAEVGLTEDYDYVRVIELIYFGELEEVEPKIESLQKRSGAKNEAKYRQLAIQLLQAIEALIKALIAEDFAVAQSNPNSTWSKYPDTIVQTLADAEDAAIQSLAKVLLDAEKMIPTDSTNVRLWVIHTLGMTGLEPNLEFEEDDVQKSWSLSPTVQNLPQQLLKILGDHKETDLLKATTITTLASCLIFESIEAIGLFLVDTNSSNQIRVAAAKALRRFGLNGAADTIEPILLDVLGQEHLPSDLAEAVVYALGTVANKTVAESLQNLINDENKNVEVRFIAILALQEIIEDFLSQNTDEGNPKLDDKIDVTESVEDTSKTQEMRGVVINTLRQFANFALDTTQPNKLRQRVIKALGAIGQSLLTAYPSENGANQDISFVEDYSIEVLVTKWIFEPLISLLKDKILEADGEEINEQPSEEQVGEAEAKSKKPFANSTPSKDTNSDTYADINGSAAQALGEMGESTTKLLMSLLQDTDSQTRSSAAYALTYLGDVDNLPEICQALEQVLADDYWSARYWAAYALGLLGDRQNVQALDDIAVIDSNKSVQASAKKAITRILLRAGVLEPVVRFRIANP
jgi:HEAT repeat protein